MYSYIFVLRPKDLYISYVLLLVIGDFMLFVDSYKANGFVYFKVWENDKFVLFSQNKGNRLYRWELIKKTWVPDRIIGSFMIPAHFRIPKNEDFGSIAWSIADYQVLERVCQDKYFDIPLDEIQRLFVK